MKKEPAYINVYVKHDLVTPLYVSHRTLEFLRKAFPNYMREEKKGLSYWSYCIDFRDKFTKEELYQVIDAIEEFNPEWIMYKGD